MRNLDLMKHDILNSSDFPTKGWAINLKDMFILHDSESLTAVFIAEIGRLDGNSVSYRYVLYDMMKRETVGWNTPEYQTKTTSLPPIDEISYDGGRMDFSEKRRLRNALEQIVENIYASKQFDGTLREAYLSYLNDSKDKASPSMMKVYEGFIEIEEV